MSARNWFDTQQEKGLIDFKCAVTSTSSSYSAACEDLSQIQAIVDAKACSGPSPVLRPDLTEISQLRAKMAQAEAK